MDVSKLRLALVSAAALSLALAAACGSSSKSSPTAAPTTASTPAATQAPAGTPSPQGPTPTQGRRVTPAANSQLRLTSSAFADNGAIPAKYTCDVGNTIPPLEISGVPTSTVSLALALGDLDIGNFTHWVVWNIDPATTAIAEGTPPQGVEGQNSKGGAGFVAPCPASGTHHYEFDLYALNETLALDPATSDNSDLLDTMRGHVLAQARLTGTYTRTLPTTVP